MKSVVRKHLFFNLVGLSFVLACSQAFSADVLLDFNGSPGPIFPPTPIGTNTAEWRPSGGVDDSGYLAITDAIGSSRGAIIIGDLDEGAQVYGFDISADLRVGGGTDRPADGFSFNFAAFNDPAINNIVEGGSGEWAAAPNGEADLPEEGTTTGFAIGFDEWQSGDVDPDGDLTNVAFDTVGLTVRIDDVLVAQVSLPVLNVEDDEQSLQTGPAGVPADQLGWAPLTMSLDAVTGVFTATWKGEIAFEIEETGYEPTAGVLVFGGRTGGSTAHHHIDNIRIKTCLDPNGCDVVPPWPGDVNGDGHTDVADLNIIGINWRGTGLTMAEGDLTGDGNVDAADLNILGSNWNTWRDGPPAAAVPEPSSIVLLLAGLLAAFGYVRRRS